MGVRALRIAAIAFAGALALAGCRNDRDKGYGGSGRTPSGSSSTTNYGTSGPSGSTSSGTSSDQSGVPPSSANQGTGGSGSYGTSGSSSSSGQSSDQNGVPPSSTDQTQQQQRQHDVTQQNPPKSP